MAIGRIVVRLSHASLGGTGSNSWHFRSDGDFSGIGDAADDVSATIKAFYTACASLFPDTAVISWDGTVIGVGADEGATHAVAGFTNVGTTAGGVMAPALAICVGWKTSSGGRSGMGRTFVGPLVPACQDTTGTIDTAKLGIIRTAALNVVSQSQAMTLHALGVWSPQEAVLRDFTSAAVRDKFAVLRSRRD